MTDEAKRILEAAMRLSDAERAALAAALEGSIGDGLTEAEIEAGWIEEAERRRERLRSGLTKSAPWHDVRREMFEMVEQARADNPERPRQVTG